MLKLRNLLILIIAFSFVNAFPQVHTKSDLSELKKQEIVYVTNTGAKYHKGSCSYLRSSKISINKSKAISQGYTACSRCSGGSSSNSKYTSSSRCQATTKAGSQCKRSAEKGRSRCWQH